MAKKMELLSSGVSSFVWFGLVWFGLYLVWLCLVGLLAFLWLACCCGKWWWVEVSMCDVLFPPPSRFLLYLK